MNPSRIKTEYADEVMFLIEDIGFAKNTIVFVMEFASRLDAQRFKEAFAVMMERYPLMGCRFVRDRSKPFWESADLKASDLVSVTENPEEFAGFRTSPADSTHGPVMSACIMRSPDGDSLVIKCHHTFCDVGGIKEFVYQLSDIYMNGEKDSQPGGNLPAAQDRSLDKVIREIPFRAYPRIVMNGFREFIGNSIPFRSRTLPLENSGLSSGYDFCVRHIGSKDFEKLSAHGRKSGATVNDMLIAAFMRSVSGFSGKKAFSGFRILITVDLRLWSAYGRMHSGICNMSTFEYVGIGPEQGETFDDTLIKVRNHTSKRKKSWYGFNQVLVINYIYVLIPFGWWTAFWKFAAWFGVKTGNIPNGLSNFGIIDKERINFGTHPERAYILPPVFRLPAFAICASGYDGTLTLSTGMYGGDPLVQRFMDGIVDQLASLRDGK